jgi:hypothetical protein
VLWSKTIQFQQRELLVPLPHIINSHLCPSRMLRLVFALNPSPSNIWPAFTYKLHSKHTLLTYSVFLKILQSCLVKIGLDPSQYSGHSLRRGGASFALECGLPSDLIKSQGDWKSDAYRSYLDPSLSYRSEVALRLGVEIQQRFPS